MNTSVAIAIAAGLVVAAVLLALGYVLLRKKVEQERKGIRTEADKALAAPAARHLKVRNPLASPRAPGRGLPP